MINSLVMSLWSRAKESSATVRGYLVGIALTAPFLADLISRKFAILAMVPLLGHVVWPGARGTKWPHTPAFLWPLVVLVCMHVAALVLPGTSTPFSGDVIKDLLFFGILVAACFTVADDNGECVLRGFTDVLIPVASGAAMLGLIKYGLLERGYVIDVIAIVNGGHYPAGTALRIDYNMFALLMLAGAAAILARAHARGWPARYAILLTLVVAAGFLTGSRRFMVLSPLIVAYWAFLIAPARPSARDIARMTAVAVGAVALCWFLPVSVPVSGGSDSKPHRFEVIDLIGSNARPSDVVMPPSVPLGTIASSMDPREGYGIGSRWERWVLARDLLAAKSPFFGMGFAYHSDYACAFSKCAHIDYPHAPVISASLLGGPLGALAAIAYYGLLLWSIWRSGRDGLRAGASAVVLATLPFAMISGDTILSVAHPIAAGLALARHRQPRQAASDCSTSTRPAREIYG